VEKAKTTRPGPIMSVVVPLVLLGLAMGSLPASALDDLQGWQGTRWGMTEEETRASLGEDAVAISPPEQSALTYAPVKVPMRIDRFQMDAILQFSTETRRLKQVVIRYPGAELEAWSTLAGLLVEKYGPPKKTKAGTRVEWVFPTTTVELARVYLPGTMSLISVRYYPSFSRGEDKGKL
jgi:hypothetical protein